MKRTATLSIIMIVLILAGCSSRHISFKPSNITQKPNIQGTYRNTIKGLEESTLQILNDGTLTVSAPDIPSLDNPYPPPAVFQDTWDHLVGGNGTWNSFGIEQDQEKGSKYQLVGQFLSHDSADMARGIESSTWHVTSDGDITNGVELYKKENGQ